MTTKASFAEDSSPVPPSGGVATRKHFWQNLVAAGISMLWNAAFLSMGLGLPAGHSRGDVGPGSLPIQVSVFGLIVSAVYLVQVLRGKDFGGSSDRIDVARVAGLLGLFIAVALSAKWIGLALCLGIGTGVATLLFPGERPFIRAIATGVGFWVIAYGLFARLLELPLP